MEKFEIRKTYVHTTGKKMKIVGAVESVAYGLCLIGEDDNGDFTPVGNTKDNAVNWEELSS